MAKFKKIFKFECPMDETHLFIDIVKLDELIETPDNISMAEFIIQKYGEEANNIVDELINLINSFDVVEDKGLIKTARKLNGTNV